MSWHQHWIIIHICQSIFRQGKTLESSRGRCSLMKNRDTIVTLECSFTTLVTKRNCTNKEERVHGYPQVSLLLTPFSLMDCLTYSLFNSLPKLATSLSLQNGQKKNQKNLPAFFLFPSSLTRISTFFISFPYPKAHLFFQSQKQVSFSLSVDQNRQPPW